MLVTRARDLDPQTRSLRIIKNIPADGLFDIEQTGGAPCRIGPEPYRITPEMAAALKRQGRLWLKFLKASNHLYLKSVRGEAPSWIAEYLDAGKPPRILDFGRMNRFKTQFPMVLRPDLLLTDDGPVACELDSVPGGIGLLACLTRLYEQEGFQCVGSPDGMVAGFQRALARIAGVQHPKTAIVVSEESKMYRPEMRWLAEALREGGTPCWTAAPESLEISETSTSVRVGGDVHPIGLVYRFFELFDLPNVPNAEPLLNAAKLKWIRLTPPPKAHQEEKLLFALLHHPALTSLWEAELEAGELAELRALVIPTWVLDPRPVPPHATIAGLSLADQPVQSWETLAALSQKERALVLKPSGFAPDAWGSHSVKFGFDLSQEDWAHTVQEALKAFPDRPWVLQPFRKPSLIRASYYDPGSQEVRELEGRVRLTPFYFVTGEDEVELGGVLATICPADKKAIHGMPDAIMIPCAT